MNACVGPERMLWRQRLLPEDVQHSTSDVSCTGCFMTHCWPGISPWAACEAMAAHVMLGLAQNAVAH